MREVYQIENEIYRLNDLKDNIDFVLKSLELKLSVIKEVEIDGTIPESCKSIPKSNTDAYQQLESRVYDFISEKSGIVEFDLSYGDKKPYRE